MRPASPVLVGDRICGITDAESKNSFPSAERRIVMLLFAAADNPIPGVDDDRERLSTVSGRVRFVV